MISRWRRSCVSTSAWLRNWREGVVIEWRARETHERCENEERKPQRVFVRSFPVRFAWFAFLAGYSVFICSPALPRGESLSLIHISEPTRQAEISYAVFCL